MNNSNSLIILIIDKLGIIKKLNVKNFNYEELYKKCGFKKSDDFSKLHNWNINFENINYNISLYGKTTGRSNYINKYQLPFPLSELKLYGSICIICEIFNNNVYEYCNLNIELWEKIYEILLNNPSNIELNKENKEEKKQKLLKGNNLSIKKENNITNQDNNSSFIDNKNNKNDIIYEENITNDDFNYNIIKEISINDLNDLNENNIINEINENNNNLLNEDDFTELEEEEYDYS